MTRLTKGASRTLRTSKHPIDHIVIEEHLGIKRTAGIVPRVAHGGVYSTDFAGKFDRALSKNTRARPLLWFEMWARARPALASSPTHASSAPAHFTHARRKMQDFKTECLTKAREATHLFTTACTEVGARVRVRALRVSASVRA